MCFHVHNTNICIMAVSSYAVYLFYGMSYICIMAVSSYVVNAPSSLFHNDCPFLRGKKTLFVDFRTTENAENKTQTSAFGIST